MVIERELCRVMHKFVKEHINEVKESYSTLGFKNEKDMLSQIKSNYKIAIWALTELLDWGMRTKHTRDFIFETFEKDGFDVIVYKIVDKTGKSRFFTHDWGSESIKEVKAKIKLVEVRTWEEVENENH